MFIFEPHERLVVSVHSHHYLSPVAMLLKLLSTPYLLWTLQCLLGHWIVHTNLLTHVIKGVYSLNCYSANASVSVLVALYPAAVFECE